MDFSIYRTPEPNRRVWSNVFVDSKTESYTLVTEQKEEGQPGYPLWHKEYPIGQGLADFLYTNLAEVEKVILQIRDAFETCAAGAGEADALQEANDHIFFTCKYCRKSFCSSVMRSRHVPQVMVIQKHCRKPMITFSLPASIVWIRRRCCCRWSCAWSRFAFGRRRWMTFSPCWRNIRNCSRS